ncbi:MAG: hypothetical protein J3K34DRAFT_518589, partial [Monoraphidium minutum]
MRATHIEYLHVETRSQIAAMGDTRRTILAAIREQARLLRDGRKDSDPVAWTQPQWWESFVYLFVSGGGSYCTSGEHHDDLLFFVRAPPAGGAPAAPGAAAPAAPPPRGPGAPARPPPAAARGPPGGAQQQPAAAAAARPEPFFVRRRAPQLPDDLGLSGAGFAAVDWAASVLLNTVLQSRYQLTVVSCGRESLAFVAEGRTWAPRMRAVSRPVFASPTVTAVNLDSTRGEAAAPAACYPDTCFAIDNFDAAFDDLVLSEADHCYCVVLHALLDDYGGAPSAPPTPLGGLGSGLGSGGGGLRGSHGGCGSSAGLRGSGGGGGSSANLRGSGGGGDSSVDGGGGGGSSSGGAGGAGAGPDVMEEQQQRQEQQQQGAVAGGSGRETLPSGPAPIRTASAAVAAASSAAGSSSGGAAAPGAGPGPPSAAGSGGGAAAASPGGWRIGTRQRCLFAGYVSYEQIVEFIAQSRGPARNLLDALLGGAAPPSGRDKVVMTGPGGVGRAEVAVTRVAEAQGGGGGGGGGRAPGGGGGGGGSQHGGGGRGGGGGGSEHGGGGKGPGGGDGDGGFGGLLQRGFSRARQAAAGLGRALQAELAGAPPEYGGGGEAGGGGGGGSEWRVQCALMLLKLPVDHLARELLEAV